MDGAVAHKDQSVSLLHLKAVFIDPFSLKFPDILRNFHQLSVPDKDAARIVILHQIGISIMENLQNTEGRVGHLAHLADRKGLTDGIHTFLQSSPV